MLTIENLNFSYDSGPKILDDVSINLKEGEIVSLLGPSGCGKSTLLRLIAGLEHSGDLSLSNTHQTSFVFQEAALLPWKTVRQNVSLPLKLQNANDEMIIDSALEAVGLIEFQDRYPAMLSGGQKMRVSIARALVSKATLLLMDEPFGALDEILRFKLNDLLLDLHGTHNWNILFVTHSIFEAAYISDWVLVMGKGKIIGEIRPELDKTLIPQEQRSSQAFLKAVSDITNLLEESYA
ncbi:ABC transporter ATP-binding protein [Kordiimonas sp. SCSIO 12610]|uniref:ABC transporter ATP-binding protein n=1 Tax=Kordiimonas sp. SCSIO 12610 TaxID=2829597 RepID=UPI00210A9B3D|nr:ABC transporter ATP-binding protein [Kordiimonas sp. SCSIO 12610]UTW53900.1 ABC transporter ATP-binding protein [Kordiimonas sp. SCSIO 12610]